MRRDVRGCAAILAVAAVCGCATAPRPVEAPGGTPPALPDHTEQGGTPPAFVVGPGDELRIYVHNHPDLTMTVRVPPSGSILYPFLGEIPVAGRTLGEVRDALTAGLAEGYIPNPQIAVNIENIQGRKIYVLGEVRNPGVFYAEDQMDAVEAISLAGGLTQDARRSAVLLIRRSGEQTYMNALDLGRLFGRADFSQNVGLQTGDILYVPPSRIANVEQFFLRLNNILTPIRANIMEGIILAPRVEDVLRGEDDEGIPVQIE